FQFLRKKLLDMDAITIINLNSLCQSLNGIDPKEFTKKEVYQSTSVGKKKIYDFLIESTMGK
ncbi:TPA: hypothetical protein ACIVV2_003977, partial [Salmonella enterica subsp. enterica serovar Bareilly]